MIGRDFQMGVDVARLMVDEATESVQGTGGGIICTLWTPKNEKEQIFFSCGTNTLSVVCNGEFFEVLETHSAARIISAQGHRDVGEITHLMSARYLGKNCNSDDIHYAVVPRGEGALAILAVDGTFPDRLSKFIGSDYGLILSLQTGGLYDNPARDRTLCVFNCGWT